MKQRLYMKFKVCVAPDMNLDEAMSQADYFISHDAVSESEIVAVLPPGSDAHVNADGVMTGHVIVRVDADNTPAIEIGENMDYGFSLDGDDFDAELLAVSGNCDDLY